MPGPFEPDPPTSVRPMEVLVTGGAGFIGSHVVEGFLRAGTSVRVLDDLSTGAAENLPPTKRRAEERSHPALLRVLLRGAHGAPRAVKHPAW